MVHRKITSREKHNNSDLHYIALSNAVAFACEPDIILTP